MRYTRDSSVDQRQIAELERICGPDAVLHEPSALLAYECDALAYLARIAGGSSSCRSTAEEVQAVVRFCHREGVPFVPRGHGTGLSGGALPVAGGMVIALSRLNRVIDVDIPEPAGDRRARRDEPRDHQARGALRLLLRA